MSGDSEYSKERIEFLCDGIFAIAMTLLVLELKVPELPRNATSAEIWHALRERAFPFAGFLFTFILGGQFWILHHRMFHYLVRANGPLVVLSVVFMMFVSLLPFSTSMLTSFSLRQPVSLAFYLGNQFVLALLLSLQWIVAERQGLISHAENERRRTFGIVLSLQPISFGIGLLLVMLSPSRAMASIAITQTILNVFGRRRAKAVTMRAQVAAAPAGHERS